MNTINLKREILGSLDSAIDRVTLALKGEGFGVLTRIDLHTKIKEKIGKDLAPTMILGACNPQLAFDAYSANSDVASLLPCNAVVRDIGQGKISIELAKPTAMMEMLGDQRLIKLAATANEKLVRALERSNP